MPKPPPSKRAARARQRPALAARMQDEAEAAEAIAEIRGLSMAELKRRYPFPPRG